MKKIGPTRSRTWVTGFKVQGANHYTIGPILILILAFLYKFSHKKEFNIYNHLIINKLNKFIKIATNL